MLVGESTDTTSSAHHQQNRSADLHIDPHHAHAALDDHEAVASVAAKRQRLIEQACARLLGGFAAAAADSASTPEAARPNTAPSSSHTTAHHHQQTRDHPHPTSKSNRRYGNVVDNDDNDHNDGRPATAIGIHRQRGATSSPTTSVPTQPIITTTTDISATPSFDVDHERVVVAVVSDNNVNSDDDDDGYFGDEEDVADSVVVGTSIDHHATARVTPSSPTPPIINQPKPTPARNRYGPDSEDDDDTDFDEEDEEDDASPLFSRRGH